MTRRGLTARDWSWRAKQLTLELDKSRLKEAIANFRKIDRVDEQMSLAQEIAETRAGELCLAYHNVDMVAYGYKRRRVRNRGERVYKTPCVIFVVRTKWKKGAKHRDKRQHLPSRLLSYAWIKGRRELCAVPTDVQPVSRFRTAVAHSASAVYANDHGFGEYGSVTAAIRLDGQSGAGLYLLSCQHVLSPDVRLGASSILAGTPVIPVVTADAAGDTGQQEPTEGPAARSVGYGGQIRGDGSPSFDVQLAQVANRSWLRKAIQDLNLSSQNPFVTERSTLDQMAEHNNFEILVPANHPRWIGSHRGPVVAAFSQYMPPSFGIAYEVRVGGSRRDELIHHWLLVELRVLGAARPEPGDSGSPVVAYLADGTATLVGMHIAAGDDASHAYMIPAWQLLDRANYWRLPQGASLRLVNP